MSDEAPRSERHVDRRHFVVGGASVVAAGVLAPAALADDDGGEPETRLIEATVADHVSSDEIEAEPVAAPDDEHRFSVDLTSGARGAKDFPVGAAVAIVLAPGAGNVDVDDLGQSSEAVTARDVAALVRGKRSDVRR